MEKIEWGLGSESFNRLEGAIQKAVDKYEPGMDKQPKKPGEYPCCDALHELHSSVTYITNGEEAA